MQRSSQLKVIRVLNLFHEGKGFFFSALKYEVGILVGYLKDHNRSQYFSDPGLKQARVRVAPG